MPLKLTIETDGAVWACDWNECLMKWGITAILWNFQTVMHQATRPQHESSAWYLLTVLHLLNVVTFYWCGRRFLFMIEKEIICKMTNNWYLNWRIQNIGWVSHVEIYRLSKGHDWQSFDSGHETSEINWNRLSSCTSYDWQTIQTFFDPNWAFVCAISRFISHKGVCCVVLVFVLAGTVYVRFGVCFDTQTIQRRAAVVLLLNHWHCLFLLLLF